jgi:hypothetical protein
MKINIKTDALISSDTNLQHNTEHSHGVGYLPALLLQLERPCSFGAPNWSEAHCLADTEINTIKGQIIWHTHIFWYVVSTK